MKERVDLLDNLKGLLIFLVVFGHSLELFKDEYFITQVLYVFIYLFHMPAFVFVSGYLSKNVDKARQTAFTTFFLPFLLFNILWNGIAAIVTWDLDKFSFITPGWALWYLMSMFLWKISLKDLVRIKYIVPISFIVGLGAGIFGEFNGILSLSRTLVFFPFFLIGYFTSEDRFFKLKKPSRFFSCGIILLALSFAIFICYFKVFPVEFLYGSDSFQTYTVPIWLGLISRALLYIIGFSFVFVLANTMTAQNTFFSKIGRNTLPIYILHTYLLCIPIAINYFIPSMWIRLFICLVSAMGITYVLSRNTTERYFRKFLASALALFLKNESR
ncbi:MAG: acyltransferase family protein [Clostridiales bacterium]|uniref:acyltransferase family protein n=1 Tax=Zhenhengia sp. TaxID=2944208 RepID=UPI001B5F02F3|nr:acyltransferase family protein [Niameybacter sp.]MDU6359976.1 acyltransferase family protein [Clostridiales bacterium]